MFWIIWCVLMVVTIINSRWLRKHGHNDEFSAHTVAFLMGIAIVLIILVVSGGYTVESATAVETYPVKFANDTVYVQQENGCWERLYFYDKIEESEFDGEPHIETRVDHFKPKEGTSFWFFTYLHDSIPYDVLIVPKGHLGDIP